MVASETGRVDAWREVERVKPNGYRVAGALSQCERGIDRQQIGDDALRGGRLGDQLEELFWGDLGGQDTRLLEVDAQITTAARAR
jgi:hypothetical protein